MVGWPSPEAATSVQSYARSTKALLHRMTTPHHERGIRPGVIRFDGGSLSRPRREDDSCDGSHRGPTAFAVVPRFGRASRAVHVLARRPSRWRRNQPLTNEDESLVLVMDGRSTIGRRFERTCSIAMPTCAIGSTPNWCWRAATRRWGPECLARIDGDFALVIWTSRRRTAFCARDRDGQTSPSINLLGRQDAGGCL